MDVLAEIPKGPSRAERLRARQSALFVIAALLGLAMVISFLVLESTPGILILSLLASIVAHAYTSHERTQLTTRAADDVMRADDTVEDDGAIALELAKSSLAGGAAGMTRVLGWLVVARVAEKWGELDDADVATERALDDATKVGQRPLLARALAQRAFVKAALGQGTIAEGALAQLGPHEVHDAVTAADFVRAKALVAYQRGDHRTVVDLTTEAFGARVVWRRRDIALLESLRQSSLLRLGAGGPMRVSIDPGPLSSERGAPSDPVPSSEGGGREPNDADRAWAESLLSGRSVGTA